MSYLEIALIINSIFSLSCYAYLFPIGGTKQHRYPLGYALFTDIQGLVVLITFIILFGWIWGLILGVFLYFFGKVVFMPIAIVLHLSHNINLIKQKIPETKFTWDTLTNFINFFWMTSIVSLLILIVAKLLMQ